jgi:putative restriction endonuclease
VGSGSGEIAKSLPDRFAALRQHQRNGQRSPHKPLLVLLALGRLAGTGSSMLPWSVAEPALADLIAEFGPPSRTGRAQSAAYPFTRLRADGGLWVLDQDVPMDLVGPLAGGHVAGRFEWSVEDELRADPALAGSIVRMLALSNFPETVASDVLEAVGLDPRSVLGSPEAASWESGGGAGRRRDPGWRSAVLQAWDRQCAFCGYDGQLAGAAVGIDAAHVRWFAFGGPDALDNGLALCALHHKLFDLGCWGWMRACGCRYRPRFPRGRSPGGRCMNWTGGRWRRGRARGFRPLSMCPGTVARSSRASRCAQVRQRWAARGGAGWRRQRRTGG